MAKRGWPDGPGRVALERRHRDPRIDRDEAVFVGEQRIEIDLAHLREVGRQLRELDQHQRDRGLVHRRPRRDRP